MPCALHWTCAVLLLNLLHQVDSTEQAPVCDCRCPAPARQAGGESSTIAACCARSAEALSKIKHQLSATASHISSTARHAAMVLLHHAAALDLGLPTHEVQLVMLHVIGCLPG